jgi:glycosyltransferase involved in cell wall biosynthesis
MGYSSNEFKSILKKIGKGEPSDDSQVLPFLELESKEDRYQVNLELAESYYSRHKRLPDWQALNYAKSCIDRALLLSRYSPEVLPLLIKIGQALKDINAIKEALKQVGIQQAALGNFDEALTLLDRWQYADAEFTGIDLHSYDPDIITCVERMGALHRFEPWSRPRPERSEKLRIAYLMQGLTQVNSVLVKIDQVFARLHDKSRFEIAYFTVDGKTAVAASQDAQAAIRSIRGSGCEMFVAPDSGTLYEQLLSVGGQIHDFAPDILVTTGALATFKNYFVASLKPAPVTISFNQGSSTQFSWHTFDHSISWFRALLLDCPANCSHVPLEFELHGREEVEPASRSELNIPASATVMASGGRRHKFQDPDYWRAMRELLLENPDLHWIVIGFDEGQVPFLKELLTAEARAKIRFLGWRHDYMKLLAAADLVVDSYPLGGGVFTIEAMGLGLPVLSFKHDYISAFTNDQGSGGAEIVGMPETLIKRGDFEQLKKSVTKMVVDKEYRRQLGERCYEHARETRSEPERMVLRCEEIYEKVWRERREAAEISTHVRAEARQVSPPLGAGSEEQSIKAYKRMLLEQAETLNRRDAELKQREIRRNGYFLSRVRRGLGRRWHELRGK